MEENPYSAFWGAVREDWEDRRLPVFRLGTVVSAEPLVIQCGGLALDQGDLVVNRTLLRGRKEQLRLTGPEKTVEAEAELLEPILAPGDQVAMVTEDNQLFALLCKVVKLG